MKTRCWPMLLFLAFLAAACSGVSREAAADLTVNDVWARESPTMGGNGAVYMVIENGGGEDDALVAVRSRISHFAELHETQMENDVMRMRPVPDQRIEIPAGGQVALQPGGLHIMLIDLTQPLAAGDTFDITLQFEKSGERTLPVMVRALDAVN